jgi:hypothetical protein
VAIRSSLQEDPDALLRAIVETLSISPETIRTHMSRIDYTLKTLRCIPQGATCGLKHGSFDNAFAVTSQISCTRARWLAACRHGGRNLIFLKVCSRSNMDTTG